jgi:peptidoglycan/xylan/chitin deacetylase (PgdA/CDA1 family)
MRLARICLPLAWLILTIFLTIILAACDNVSLAVPTAIAPVDTPTLAEQPTSTTEPLPTATLEPMASPTSAFVPVPASERGFVPILCYHHIRDWAKSDTADDKAYIVPPTKLEKELKYLKESGYHSITSEQVYEYYAFGKPLPNKPIMLSFDDDDESQYTNALPLLKKYGFDATFFIMTVTMDKENYMTSEQIKDLDKQGFDVQPHTWDHRIVTEYKTEEDWQRQIVGPKQTLEDLLGHPTPFFAYPFGIYDVASAEKIKSYGYKAAFRLRDVMDDKTDPLFAIKRYIANAYWTVDQFEEVVQGAWEH